MSGEAENHCMTLAKDRIKELEHMVAILTERIKVEEMKNKTLQEYLATFQGSSKITIPWSATQVCSVQEMGTTCEENIWKATNNREGPGKARYLTKDVQVQEMLGPRNASPCGDFLAVHRPESSPISTAETDNPVGQSACGTFIERGTSRCQDDRNWREIEKAISTGLQKQVTRRIALKVMYFGSRYDGFASQGSSQKTVESELFAALKRTKLLIGDRHEVNYSRCGRTDKGVSAIGQLIALQLRSKHQSAAHERDSEVFPHDEEAYMGLENNAHAKDRSSTDRVAAARASRSLELSVSCTIGIVEEIDYVGVLNRVLPADIRILGWCPVPQDFDARFSCLYREYKYFFINSNLDIDAMTLACSKFVGDHDFRNFCKMDATNVHNYRRTISIFEICPVKESWAGIQIWMMRVRGTAFLWHQIRFMAAILFMVGQGYESPAVVDELLNVEKVVRKPQYIMASELPLVLHSCGFQGLTLHCQPKAARNLHLHLNYLMEETLVRLALIQEALSELPCPGLVSDVDQPKKHVPLLLRSTEPSYEERRNRVIV